MGLGGRLYHFDNAPQDEESAEVAEAAQSRHHPATNAGPNYLPSMFAIRNPAMEEDDSGWSTSKTSNSH